jgi:hypothetical protein
VYESTKGCGDNAELFVLEEVQRGGGGGEADEAGNTPIGKDNEEGREWCDPPKNSERCVRGGTAGKCCDTAVKKRPNEGSPEPWCNTSERPQTEEDEEELSQCCRNRKKEYRGFLYV